MIYTIIFFSVTACFLSWLVCKNTIWLAPKVGLVDKPGERKIHETCTPIGGGIGIWLGLVVAIAVAQAGLYAAVHSQIALPFSLNSHLEGLWSRSDSLWMLLGLSSVVFLLGLMDDFWPLGWRIRIAIQTLIAVLAVYLGWKASVFSSVPFLSEALSVLWIVGLINSFNLLDNMNGLSAGVAAICCIFLATIMFLSPNATSHEPQYFIAGFLSVLFGSLLGFLYFNNPYRGMLFMGSSGAYLIGFLLAVLTLSATFTGYGPSQKQGIFVPLCILAVPLYDTFTVVLIRLREKRSPFEGDKSHFSHRLVKLGLSKPSAVLTIYLTTTICAIGAVLLYLVPFYGAVLIAAQVFLTLSLIAILEGQKSSQEPFSAK